VVVQRTTNQTLNLGLSRLHIRVRDSAWGRGTHNLSDDTASIMHYNMGAVAYEMLQLKPTSWFTLVLAASMCRKQHVV
jgi:hypothetical protein